jgi:hypothetical protein
LFVFDIRNPRERQRTQEELPRMVRSEGGEGASDLSGWSEKSGAF